MTRFSDPRSNCKTTWQVPLYQSWGKKLVLSTIKSFWNQLAALMLSFLPCWFVAVPNIVCLVSFIHLVIMNHEACKLWNRRTNGGQDGHCRLLSVSVGNTKKEQGPILHLREGPAKSQTTEVQYHVMRVKKVRIPNTCNVTSQKAPHNSQTKATVPRSCVLRAKNPARDVTANPMVTDDQAVDGLQ